jgi:hypothetical protein
VRNAAARLNAASCCCWWVYIAFVVTAVAGVGQLFQGGWL